MTRSRPSLTREALCNGSLVQSGTFFARELGVEVERDDCVANAREEESSASAPSVSLEASASPALLAMLGETWRGPVEAPPDAQRYCPVGTTTRSLVRCLSLSLTSPMRGLT